MNAAQRRTCPACEAVLRRAARFCPTCGAPTDEEVTARRARRLERARIDRRAAAAVATVFGGTVLAVVVARRVAGADPTTSLAITHAVFYSLVALVGAASIGLLGSGAARASLASPGRPAWWLVGPALGALGVGISLLYVGGLASLYGLDVDSTLDRYSPDLATIVSVALLPALFEEWLTRGVLWTACERVTTPARTILITALLFAFMHGVGSGFLAYPHRFVSGLVAGWLRHRSGSLVPGIAQHFTRNLLCVLLL